MGISERYSDHSNIGTYLSYASNMKTTFLFEIINNNINRRTDVMHWKLKMPQPAAILLILINLDSNGMFG